MVDLGSRGRTAFGDQTFLVGEGAAGPRLREELEQRGWNTVVVFASGASRRSGLVSRVLGEAFADTEVHDWPGSIRAHAPTTDIEAIADSFRAKGITPDALVSIGGGKVVDTAKGLAILLGEGGRLEDHCARLSPSGRMEYPSLSRPKLPIIAVPTTLSGAEVTPGCGLTNPAGSKRIFWDRKIAARLVCYAPDVLAEVPQEVIATSGMNALAHCAEAMYSKTAGPISTGLATVGAEYLTAGLLAHADDRDPELLSRLGGGAAMAALALCNARSGLHHAICHVLGGMFKVPHGVANSIVLPHALRHNLPCTRPEQERFRDALARSLAIPADTSPPRAVEMLQERLGVPTRLRDTAVREDDIPAAAAAVLEDPARFYNPRDITSAAEVEEVLRAAW